MNDCRVCGGHVQEFLDLGRQPLANGFLLPEEVDREFFFRLAIGICSACTMVQMLDEVPRQLKYHLGYPYHTSGTNGMRTHFEHDAEVLLRTELVGGDAFIVEIGCNDGALLAPIAAAGVRHLGVEPSGTVAEMARAKGVQVIGDFFGPAVAADIRSRQGPADVIFGANTICHIAAVDALFAGIDELLSDSGAFIFEEPYLGTILDRFAFDQIYDEHFYLFTARSVRAMAERFGFELVDVQSITPHGGELRYTLARQGARHPSPAIAEHLLREERHGLADLPTLRRFADGVAQVRHDLLSLLQKLREKDLTVAGYGAPGKSTTVTNYCGIGPELVSFVCDTTPSKQGRLGPGSHIPIVTPEVFARPYPDYAVLFAWNYADEIIAREKAFRESGGRWILYVPDVHVV